MRALLWVAIVALAGWSGWWWFASAAAERGATDWFDQRQAAGWTAEHGGITRAGFPNRIDLTVTEPRLVSADGRWGWQAPFVQSFALSYKPWHLIAAFAPAQQVLTPLGPLQVTAGKLQASLVLKPGRDLTLERLQLAGEQVGLGGVVGIQRLSLATRPTLDRALAHDLGIEAQEITLPPALLGRLPAGLLPPTAAILRLDAAVGFSAPLDRHAGASQPQITTVTLRELRGEWGAIRLHLSGSLTPDAAGLAEGRLDLRLEGANEVLELAQAAGLLTPATRPGWESMLGSLTPAGGALELPLRLSGGAVMLGPLVLGPAPRLRP